MKVYRCQFAPNAATRQDAIRVGQLVRDEGASAYEAFAPDAFSDTRAAEVAVLIDHDVSKRAGTVRAKVAQGDWHSAEFVLDGPYAAEAALLIERHGKVSPGFTGLDKEPGLARPISDGHNPTHWYSRARLNEISILLPGSVAWYAGAKVTHVHEQKARSSSAAGSGSRRSSPIAGSPLPEPAVRELGRHVEGRDLVLDMSDGSQVIYSNAAHRLNRSTKPTTHRADEPWTWPVDVVLEEIGGGLVRTLGR